MLFDSSTTVSSDTYFTNRKSDHSQSRNRRKFIYFLIKAVDPLSVLTRLIDRGETAVGGFAILLVHVHSGLVHGGNHIVKGDLAGGIEEP